MRSNGGRVGVFLYETPTRPSPFQGEGVEHDETRMRRRFVTLDVFTQTRFAGNPLAVVLESDGLDKDAMQTIAREFNLAETVFVMQPANPAPSRDAAHLHAEGGIAVCRPSDHRHRGAARLHERLQSRRP